MLHRKFSTWADTNTLRMRCLYLTCIRPHLEYACQLWDPYTTEGIHSLESVQKFSCRVCLKQWNLDYDSMLELLDIPLLAARRKYIKLTTIIESVDSISRDERGFHWGNTLKTGEYLALGTLSHILNTTIVFYGWFPIEWVYNIAIIAQFRCAPREVKNHHFAFLFLFSSGPTTIVSYLLTLVYM